MSSKKITMYSSLIPSVLEGHPFSSSSCMELSHNKENIERILGVSWLIEKATKTIYIYIA